MTRHRKEKQSFRRRNRRSRSPFASYKHDDASDDEEGDAVGIWPKVHIVHNVVTGYPCGYAFAHFASEVDAERVLRNWYSQTATETNTTSTTSNTSHRRIKNEKHRGLDIPNGEKDFINCAISHNSSNDNNNNNSILVCLLNVSHSEAVLYTG
ncbi:unnamed protein product [Trichobilharzia regenti]|nr:unnamed protein product [Trichobilharzia regenti]